MNLEGFRLRYLIGGNNDGGADGAFTVVGYDATNVPNLGIGGKYVNLFDEKQTGQYGPYLHSSDTAKQYNEGQCDPAGGGFWLNLTEQIGRAKAQGFTILGDIDNRDAYSVSNVLRVYDQAAAAGFEVICKNPGMSDLEEGTTVLLRHPAVIGAIVEKGNVAPLDIQKMRLAASKPSLPIWFVSFGGGKLWAQRTAAQIQTKGYINMGVTYSPNGEYASTIDIRLPAKG